jgi:hypothetical protein
MSAAMCAGQCAVRLHHDAIAGRINGLACYNASCGAFLRISVLSDFIMDAITGRVEILMPLSLVMFDAGAMLINILFAVHHVRS